MEELLQSVTSVRRGFEQRRKSRLHEDPINVADLMLHLSPTNLNSLQKASLKTSFKIPEDVHLISTVNKLNLDEFSRFLKSPLKSQGVNFKLSPNRKRTYKLDAANLLVSRIKVFLSKRLKHWKKYTDMFKNNERKIPSARGLVFKVNMGNLNKKERYVSREKVSDDEVTQKANTSRHSSRSPICLEFTKAKPNAVHRNNIGERLEIENLRSKRSNLSISKDKYPIPGKKILPSTTRFDSSYSFRNLDKISPKLSTSLALDKIVTIMSSCNKLIARDIFVWIAEYVKKCNKLNILFSICTDKVRKAAGEMLEQWKEHNCLYDIAIGSRILTVMYLNKIADIFHFMKFRCVIEIGIFDESIGESSEEQLKDCLDSIEDVSLFKSIKRGKSLSYLLYIKSFANLMHNIEEKARFRHYEDIKSAILHCHDAGGINIEYTQILSLNEIRNTRQTCLNIKLQKSALNSIFRNLSKDIVYKYMRCIEQWKYIAFRAGSYDKYTLQVITFHLQINKLVHERLKLIFSIARISTYRASSLKNDLKSSIIRGVARLQRYLKNIKKNVFIHWKMDELIEIFQVKSSYKLVNYFVQVLKIKLSEIFTRIRINGSLMKNYKYIIINHLCIGFKLQLSKKFNVWKSVPENYVVRINNS